MWRRVKSHIFKKVGVIVWRRVKFHMYEKVWVIVWRRVESHMYEKSRGNCVEDSKISCV